MPYYVTRLNPRKQKISLDDIMFDLVDINKLHSIQRANKDTVVTGTRTFYFDHNAKISDNSMIQKQLIKDIDYYVEVLEKFYDNYKYLDVAFDRNYDYNKQVEMISKVKRDAIKSGECLADEEIEEIVKEQMSKIGLKYNSNYYTFYIPKKKGGLRRIDAPEIELKNALTHLKELFEDMMHGNTYHTAAFAYIKNRSTLDLVKKLQKKKTRWILKLDFSNFFGSIDLEFLMRQLKQIYPFSEIASTERGETALFNCLKLCFLNGVLPQGTPISPLLTNILMIPFDHHISNLLKDKPRSITEFDNDDGSTAYSITYTRYADDMFIGSHRGFRYKPIVDYIKKHMSDNGYPLVLNTEKTRYCSNAGQNWMLGLMYNENMDITVGSKRKKHTHAMINNFCMDIKNGNNLCNWDPHTLQVALGNIWYVRQIEREYCNNMLKKYSDKFGFDVEEKMKEMMQGGIL